MSSTAVRMRTAPRAEAPARPSISGQTQGLALAVADVGWPNTENLFREVERESAAVLRLRCQDYVNGWRARTFPWSPACRLRQCSPDAWEQEFVLPSGWMKRFPRIGMRPIARGIRNWWSDRPADWLRGLVMLFPHYLYLHQQTQPDVSLYYNIDDYTLYWPRQAEQVRALELEAVRKADLTVCVARARADALRAAVPEAADRIHHMAHGAPTPFLADEPLVRPADPPADIAHLPRPLLGYIGFMEDRVDWELMDRLAIEFPHASFVVVGRPRPPSPKPWWTACDSFLNRPNVHAIGWRAQHLLPGYYQSFDVSLIPYQMDHPFNLMCSPTKIMDNMGSGRPVVATALPECRLHAERFHVVDHNDAFVASVRDILENGSDDGRAAIRHAFALDHTCHIVVERILDLLVASGR